MTLTLVQSVEEVTQLAPSKVLKRPCERSLVAVCSWCMKIRDASGTWIDPGMLFFKFFRGKLTHTICEHCCKQYFPEFSRSIFESCQPVDSHECLQPPKAPIFLNREH
jgi:hypothetical protein